MFWAACRLRTKSPAPTSATVASPISAITRPPRMRWCPRSSAPPRPPALSDMLKAGGRGGALDLGHHRMRGGLVIAEIGLATVALVGAGLFVRSLQAAQNIDLGYDARHI